MSDETLFEHLRDAENLGQPALAIELGRIYLERHPENWAGLIYFARALQSVARYDEAEAAFLRARAVSSPRGAALVLRHLGLLAQDRGDTGAARRWFHDAIAVSPEDAAGYVYLGSVLAKLGNLGEAEIIHRQGVECSVGCIDEAWLNLGLVQRAQGKYLDALDSLRVAQRLDPTDGAVQAAIDDIEAVLFRFPEA